MNSNYKSAVHRINNANNSGDLEQLINSFTNLYNLGILTESEYQRNTASRQSFSVFPEPALRSFANEVIVCRDLDGAS